MLLHIYILKLTNLDVCDFAAIGNSLPYKIYNLLLNLFYDKEMLNTLTVAYEGTSDVKPF